MAEDTSVGSQDSSARAGSQATTDATNSPGPSASPSAFAFAGGVALGSDVILSGDNGTAQTWTKLSFQPDLSFGKIGLGLDLPIHFMLYQTTDQAVTIYGGDWIPNYENNGKSFFDVYLPKIMYVRYGKKGEDPFFAKFGSISDLSLGDGFIMSNYSNMLFLPAQRIFGLDLGLDGTLFQFPYVGIEAIAGNLARLDVMGARVYGRPLIDTSIPILKDLQVGATFVGDTNPYLYENTGSASPVGAYGADILVPIIGGSLFPLSTFTDLAFDPNESAGWMIGAGGRIIGIFTYGAQLRVLQDGFVPSYFDANYDLYRAERYDYMQLAHGTNFTPSWYASLGTSLLSDKLVFNVALDGPFAAPAVVANLATASQTDYPHLRGVLSLAQIDTIPVYFDASYDKYYIGAIKGFFPDLVDPTDAVIGMDINYKTGAAVLTLAYNAEWNPVASKFEVTSSLQAAVKF
jgi:hypothetical protein